MRVQISVSYRSYRINVWIYISMPKYYIYYIK